MHGFLFLLQVRGTLHSFGDQPHLAIGPSSGSICMQPLAALQPQRAQLFLFSMSCPH